jgi:hypothetical protein
MAAGGPTPASPLSAGAPSTPPTTPAVPATPLPANPADTTGADSLENSTSLEGYTAAAPAEAVAAEPVISAPKGASPVRLVENSPRCGLGMTEAELIGSGRPSCVHTLADPAPTRPANKGAVRMAPVCHGNGVNGPRIQFLYVYVEGRPNRIAEYKPHMLNSWIPAMEGSFRSTSKEQGRELGMRVYMPNCKIDIGVVELPKEDGEPDNPGAMRARIEEAVYDAGYEDNDRKYHVWFDGANKGACGVAPAYLIPGVGDNPTPANINNIGTVPVVGLAQVAVTFKHGVPVPHDTPPMCFGRGAMGATTEIHELLHLLGSVSPGAPNSNGLGHCRDEVDIMCYSEGGVFTYTRCAVQVEQLDCGSDDYFNARPQIGSYLSTHWNTANSRFLGASPDDTAFSTLPRRP